jgi:hypothetical protein
VQLHTLEQNRPHPVLFARRLKTQYGSTVLLTLQTENVNVKIYLPKKYADVNENDHIEETNTGKKYKLLYLGKAGSAYIINIEQ